MNDEEEHEYIKKLSLRIFEILVNELYGKDNTFEISIGALASVISIVSYSELKSPEERKEFIVSLSKIIHKSYIKFDEVKKNLG